MKILASLNLGGLKAVMREFKLRQTERCDKCHKELSAGTDCIQTVVVIEDVHYSYTSYTCQECWEKDDEEVAS